MASIPNTTFCSGVDADQLENKPITMARGANNRRRIWRLRRKKKLPTVRLGGQRQPPRGRMILVRMIRRIRVRWLKLKKACAPKKLKEYYYSVLKDVMESGGSFENYQQRLLMETSFAIPVMGFTFNASH